MAYVGPSIYKGWLKHIDDDDISKNVKGKYDQLLNSRSGMVKFDVCDEHKQSIVDLDVLKKCIKDEFEKQCPEDHKRRLGYECGMFVLNMYLVYDAIDADKADKLYEMFILHVCTENPVASFMDYAKDNFGADGSQYVCRVWQFLRWDELLNRQGPPSKTEASVEWLPNLSTELTTYDKYLNTFNQK
jgi:hypothetical protein